jgi:hypothetical protein
VLGRFRAVQLTPSGEVAAALLGPTATATNVPLPYVTDHQSAELGRVRVVQVDPGVREEGEADEESWQPQSAPMTETTAIMIGNVLMMDLLQVR